MKRRLAMFVAALVLAGIGTGAVFAYVRSVNSRVASGEQMVDVLVAKKTVPSGTTGAQAVAAGMLGTARLPRRLVPVGALNNATTIDTQVAGFPLAVGEVVLPGRFASPQPTGGMVIPDDKVAITVQLDDPSRVGGFIQPGSQIAIFDTFSPPAAKGAASQDTDKATRLLLARVPVLAVGATTAGDPPKKTGSASGTSGAQSDPTALLTIAVSQHDAERVIQAVRTGNLYCALLSRQSATARSLGIDNSKLFG